MKRISILSILILLGLSVSANAHFLHRSFFHRATVPHMVPQSSALVGNSPGGTPFGGHLSLPQILGATTAPKIEVSRDVADSIDRTTKTLQDTRTDLDGLLKKYQLDTTSTTSTPGNLTGDLPPRKMNVTGPDFQNLFKR